MMRGADYTHPDEKICLKSGKLERKEDIHNSLNLMLILSDSDIMRNISSCSNKTSDFSWKLEFISVHSKDICIC